MDHDTTEQPQSPQAIADYTDVRALDEGGHGRFFLAKAPPRLGVDGDVVVKIVPGSSEAGFRRFTRELRLFARIDSPHLVRLYDAGQHEDSFFYSMEWCSRGTLESPREPLDRAAKLKALAGIARAAHALHESGIAHRDIRPGNILLRVDGSACLGDLGLAQLGSGSVTSMAPIASVGFVDPKLILGDTAGRASDIYSIGAVLHWALTGETLHPGLDTSDPMMAVRSVLRGRVVVRRDLLSAAEADVVESCTADEITVRPPTAANVADLIDSLA
ncbi:MAG TPA: serine/threonine-protein kinase [Ilumatobacteraceae bacterium]|nr:serine/threonine-protein kinase [Ilumatobacteraceae bacterium]